MCKTQIFNDILQIVSEETEINEALILSDNKSTAVVDARSILVDILREKGLYPVQIAEYLHKTPAGIRNLISGFENRKRSNGILAIYSQRIRNRMKRDS
ncbi:MAG: hypothetical protein EGP72_06335 [Phocaeicola plebeius]|jgi:predicted transcriptional regulator|uniref:hypothetical protein n=1 Tax=Phocaeicola plebeius TaxID=310297 RepID=UPI001D9AA6F6|nr:hypothetical protein [Phocaeicola plebeius]